MWGLNLIFRSFVGLEKVQLLKIVMDVMGLNCSQEDLG